MRARSDYPATSRFDPITVIDGKPQLRGFQIALLRAWASSFIGHSRRKTYSVSVTCIKDTVAQCVSSRICTFFSRISRAENVETDGKERQRRTARSFLRPNVRFLCICAYACAYCVRALVAPTSVGCDKCPVLPPWDHSSRSGGRMGWGKRSRRRSRSHEYGFSICREAAIDDSSTLQAVIRREIHTALLLIGLCCTYIHT